MVKEPKPKRPLRGRVFQCTGFPNCNKAFTRSEHLARHRRKHTGERPFSCSHCSKNFSRLDNLRQHKQTVHAFDNYVNRKEPGQPSFSRDSAPPASAVYMAASRPKQMISPPPTAILKPPRQQFPDTFASTHSHADTLRVPPTYKPKVRPQPLSLAPACADESASNVLPAPLTAALPVSVPSMYGARHGSLVEPALRTAPAGYFGSSFLSEPISALRPWSMSSSMVSPLSPLFHQSFNQVARPPARSDPGSQSGSLAQFAATLAPVRKHMPTTPVAAPETKQVPTPASEVPAVPALMAGIAGPAGFRKVSINNLLAE